MACVKLTTTYLAVTWWVNIWRVSIVQTYMYHYWHITYHEGTIYTHQNAIQESSMIQSARPIVTTVANINSTWFFFCFVRFRFFGDRYTYRRITLIKIISGRTCGLAKWIMDDSCLACWCIYRILIICHMSIVIHGSLYYTGSSDIYPPGHGQISGH